MIVLITKGQLLTNIDHLKAQCLNNTWGSLTPCLNLGFTGNVHNEMLVILDNICASVFVLHVSFNRWSIRLQAECELVAVDLWRFKCRLTGFLPVVHVCPSWFVQHLGGLKTEGRHMKRHLQSSVLLPQLSFVVVKWLKPPQSYV